MKAPPADPEHARAVATSVVRRLREAGHEAWFVGGCVREMLLGHDPADYDVTTDAVPERVTELFDRVVPVGAEFGVVLVVLDGVPIEVATFRTEGGYADGRRPDSVEYAGVEEDVRRRDLTINALLYDPIGERVVDHVGGRADLAAGLVRTVGDPRVRFAEDHLRLLRAVRFAARFGFRLEDETAAALTELAGRIERIAVERVADELRRMLLAPSRAAAVRLLDETGLLSHVLPEIAALRGVEQPVQYHPEGDVFVHTLLALEALPDEVTEAAAWGVLLHDIGKPATFQRAEDRIRFHGHDVTGAEMAEVLLRRLRFPNDLRERVVTLVREHLRPRAAPQMKRSTLRRLLAEPWLGDLLTVCRADALAGSGDLAHLERLERAGQEEGEALPPPLLTGRDLLDAGFEKGPSLGRILRRLQDEQLEGRLTTAAQALARARELRDG